MDKLIQLESKQFNNNVKQTVNARELHKSLESRKDFSAWIKRFLKDFTKGKELENILLEYTDGLIGGNILEFKLVINDVNKVLSQTIKYLSRCRINGISIPANILLIDLNQAICYRFDSQDFLDSIETVYIGSASINNNKFNTTTKPEVIDYSSDLGGARLIEILREEKYTKINLDEDCILGWANRYYREKPSANKGDFLGTNNTMFSYNGEIRHPLHFKKYINPYKEKDNEKFKYLMDTLNDRLSKKELGAFYTPDPYCKMAIEMVREAIKLVPKGNDYVILDRCAGTGNLEEHLTEEELSHCVLSTYEYYEYHVLKARLGSDVRYIIPVNEEKGNYRNGRLENADAMSEAYIKNEYLQSIINNPKITIIMLENPPYSDTSSAEFKGSGDKTVKTTRKQGFVSKEMRNDLERFNVSNVSTARDISNMFIWSAFKYYLRQPTDSYILFSPVKYFKSIGLVNKKFEGGVLLNRKHFHATPSSISLIHWRNIDAQQEEFTLKAYDIELDKTTGDKQAQVNNGKVRCEKDVVVKKVYDVFSKLYYDKDESEKVAYLRASSFNLDPNSCQLTRMQEKSEIYRKNGFYLRSDNYLEKLQLFCAKLYPQANWYERDVYFTTADGGFKYLEDKEFIKACFIFTCLSQRSKCISFTGSDDRFYKNELCFDTDTIASNHLASLTLNEDENKIKQIWDELLEKAKKTKNYQENIKYGTYQIIQELNTFEKDDKKKTIYHYPELNTNINALKEELKDFYKNNIEEKLFKYELLK